MCGKNRKRSEEGGKRQHAVPGEDYVLTQPKYLTNKTDMSIDNMHKTCRLTNQTIFASTCLPATTTCEGHLDETTQVSDSDSLYFVLSAVDSGSPSMIVCRVMQ